MIEGKATGHNLHYEHFMNDELVLVTATANSAFRLDEVNRDQLAALPLVIREAGSGTLEVLDEALTRYGLSLREMQIEIQLGSTESIKRYLYHSGTFAFVSVQAVVDELVQHKLRIIDVEGLDIRRSFSFVSAHGQHNRMNDLFKQFCLEANNYKL